MVFKNKIKLAAFVGIALSVASLLVHLLLADYSTGDLIRHKVDDFYAVGPVCFYYYHTLSVMIAVLLFFFFTFMFYLINCL